MGIFLNSIAPYEKYKSVVLDSYFVDKTALLEELIPFIGKEKKYFCITRPRRFGKTVMVNMIASFFGKNEDCSAIFDHLNIAVSNQYTKHLNQHNVICIDFSRTPNKCESYDAYISRIIMGLKNDLLKDYAQLTIDFNKDIWDILSEIFSKTREKFIFIIDEWDALFHMNFANNQEKQEYLLFLKALLKDQEYTELVYMTGILPIAKYSSGSELNMFAEYDMAVKIRFGEYFGFSDSEVDKLYEQYVKKTKQKRINRKELKDWYDGYHTASGIQIYNPRSVVYALTDNQLSNYWTSSGPYDEIFYYIKNNIREIRDDLALMILGEGIETKIQEFSASSMQLKTKSQIYSAMVVYGLLTYNEGKVFIPNKELMLKYEELIQSEDSLGYVYQLAKESEKMLKATLAGDTQTMKKILEYAHDTETPILSYNHEIELSAVVNLVYLSAREQYHVDREDKAGRGYVDFIFYPVKKNADAIILELKIDSTPQEAIEQVKEKKYALRFEGKLGETPKYIGRILAVGISYK